MEDGIYPNLSASRFKFRNKNKSTQINGSIWESFFFGDDEIFNNRVQRWDGTKWVVTQINLHSFK
jgi:hypothetical protein